MFDLPTIALVSLCFTICATLIGNSFRLTWWLSKRFEEIKTYIDAKLDQHSTLEHQRHIDNLDRFSKIELKLEGISKH